MAVYVVGVTGGSGAPYTRRLLQALLGQGHQVKLVVSPAGEQVLEVEIGLRLSGSLRQRRERWLAALGFEGPSGNLELLGHDNMAASIASGSYPTEGMVVVPCSMGALARIATGSSTNLIERAADVALKERRPLILVPRETPLSQIHLRNMLAAAQAGAEILPAMPGFYHRPATIDDLVDMLVSRILDRLGIQNDLFRRWGSIPGMNSDEG